MNLIKSWIVLLTKLFWPSLLLFLIFVGFSLAGGFEKLHEADSWFHFLGGVSMAISFYWLLNSLSSNVHSQKFRVPSLLSDISVVSLTALVALLWEWLEFCLDLLYGTNFQAGLQDTNIDLLLGTLGAVAVLIVAKTFKTNQ